VVVDDEIGTDVLVVGAGVIGASTAYHAAAAGASVTVVDALQGPAEGSTGRSFASVRGQWADSLNIELSWRSIQVYRDFPTEHGIDVGYRASGYLLLVPERAWPAHLEAVELQRRHGVPVDVLTADQAAAITPFDPAGIGGATWGPADGVVDPHLATAGFLSLARARGCQVLFRSPVTAVEPDPRTQGWSVTAGGRTIRARSLVNAAGGWSGQLAALAGLSVPVVHSRRNVYSSAAGALDRSLPMTIDVGSGVFLRSEGRRLLFGAARPDESDGYRTDVDWEWMEPLLRVATPRFPWLAELPLDRSGCWAGTYEVSPDHSGILGPDPSAPTWVNACGFSGHGLMQAPEVGRLAAEAAVEGAITSADVTPLRLDRFAVAQPPEHLRLVF
jgi:sarcosine oxidase subunit beta